MQPHETLRIRGVAASYRTLLEPANTPIVGDSTGLPPMPRLLSRSSFGAVIRLWHYSHFVALHLPLRAVTMTHLCDKWIIALSALSAPNTVFLFPLHFSVPLSTLRAICVFPAANLGHSLIAKRINSVLFKILHTLAGVVIYAQNPCGCHSPFCTLWLQRKYQSSTSYKFNFKTPLQWTLSPSLPTPTCFPFSQWASTAPTFSTQRPKYITFRPMPTRRKNLCKQSRKKPLSEASTSPTLRFLTPPIGSKAAHINCGQPRNSTEIRGFLIIVWLSYRCHYHSEQ